MGKIHLLSLIINMNSHPTLAYGTKDAAAPLERMNIERREFRDNDVEMQILYCGICHSDLHSIHNDWGHTTYPIVPGHEILGRVTRVGAKVTSFKPGDLAGVGCIVESCQHCDHCHEGEEQFCENGVTFSFNSPDKILGGMTYGGFSQSYVCEDRYVVHMPSFKNLPAAAPLLCAGITVYSPLKHWKVGKGSKVGILGIGGLGHVAIRMAKAMGAEVTVFTTSPAKVEDAKRLGADHAVLSKDAEQMRNCPKQDFILDTVSGDHDVNAYLNLLTVDGALVLVGLPAEPLKVASFNLVHGRRSFSGSNIGGIRETQEMLDFCFEHNITADSEIIKVDEINHALERLERGDVKYRFVIDMSTL